MVQEVDAEFVRVKDAINTCCARCQTGEVEIKIKFKSETNGQIRLLDAISIKLMTDLVRRSGLSSHLRSTTFTEFINEHHVVMRSASTYHLVSNHPASCDHGMLFLGGSGDRFNSLHP